MLPQARLACERATPLCAGAPSAESIFWHITLDGVTAMLGD
jgi:hypothetical protein